MSLAEIKEAARQLTRDELEELALHVEFLRKTTDPAWQKEMARRARATKGWVSQEDVIALHERLLAEGK